MAMSKKRIDEGLMKYIIKLFFPGLEKEVLADPKVQLHLREAARIAQDFNKVCEDLEQITGKSFDDWKFKRK
jgi:hypothetical protein